MLRLGGVDRQQAFRRVGFLAGRQHHPAARRKRNETVFDFADHGSNIVSAAVNLGVNPIHFGILMAFNMEVGLCHPPVGLNLYVGSGIAKMGITEMTIAVLPWLGALLTFLVIVTCVPEHFVVASAPARRFALDLGAGEPVHGRLLHRHEAEICH
jgi:hypothetical protein